MFHDLLLGIPDIGATECPSGLGTIPRTGRNVSTANSSPGLIPLIRASRRDGTAANEMSRLTAPVACASTTSGSGAASTLRIPRTVLSGVARPTAVAAYHVAWISTTALTTVSTITAIPTTARTAPLVVHLRKTVLIHIELKLKDVASNKDESRSGVSQK